ncbi:hypothetical protein [Neisseria sp. Ec49-e6-T10]|uniref:hypothetical protein n=1 Tax=Neisseria sp. Ec49-e6-T10 TaxID=3140744 RepID=UPI003EBD8882
MKVFEDYFSELQADMVSIALEYVDNEADYIYIYCSYEPNMYYFDLFYKINNKIVKKHNLNMATLIEKKYDTSDERQEIVLDIGLKNLKSIKEVCKKHERPMPTEMKLIYDVKANSLEAKYQYDLLYSDKEELLPMDIFEQWFEEVSQQ